METQGTRSSNLLLDSLYSDQSLFGCLRGGCEMSWTVIWEVKVCACVWLGVFIVTCWILLSDLLGADSYCASCLGCGNESLVIICKGCYIYNLFSAAAEIVRVHYAIIMASSVTQISSAPLNSPSSPSCRPPPSAVAESRWRADHTVWPQLIISLSCTVRPGQGEMEKETETRANLCNLTVQQGVSANIAVKNNTNEKKE